VWQRRKNAHLPSFSFSPRAQKGKIVLRYVFYPSDPIFSTIFFNFCPAWKKEVLSPFFSFFFLLSWSHQVDAAETWSPVDPFFFPGEKKGVEWRFPFFFPLSSFLSSNQRGGFMKGHFSSRLQTAGEVEREEEFLPFLFPL